MAKNRRDTGGAVSLSPVDDAGAARVGRWFEAPHVRRWWGDPAVNRDELDWHRDPDNAGACRIIGLDRLPVGYLQWTDLWAYDPETPDDLPKGTIDIDLLIGEQAAQGKGVGPRAVLLAIVEILADVRPPLITMVPSVENERAIRAYEKIGFEKRRIVTDPATGEGDAWLMTRRTTLS